MHMGEQKVPAPAASYDKKVALVLQGGGALGSYQAGVYEALSTSQYLPDWVAGISIGAINAAIIAGNAPAQRVERLQAFWEGITAPSSLWPVLSSAITGENRRTSSLNSLVFGQPGFFAPRPAMHWLLGVTPTSYYDTSALKDTLERLVDFDRINAREIRFSIGAVNVRTGNFAYFDNAQMTIRPEHVMASGALPPGFPAVEIDGEYYWDGGLVSNTPLTEVVSHPQHKKTLVFQVDLWSASGVLPGDLLDVCERAKDIQYSSRTRTITARLGSNQVHAQLIRELLKHVPPGLEKDHPLIREAQKVADGRAVNVLQLIFKNKAYQGHYKDYEFSIDTMRDHWQTGLDDIRASFEHPDWFAIPSHDSRFITHDVHYDRSPAAQIRITGA